MPPPQLHSVLGLAPAVEDECQQPAVVAKQPNAIARVPSEQAFVQFQPPQESDSRHQTADAAPAYQFQKGDEVVVHALSIASRNGRCGRIVARADKKSRFAVKLHSGRVLRLRERNIALARTPEAHATMAQASRATERSAARK